MTETKGPLIFGRRPPEEATRRCQSQAAREKPSENQAPLPGFGLDEVEETNPDEEPNWPGFEQNEVKETNPDKEPEEPKEQGRMCLDCFGPMQWDESDRAALGGRWVCENSYCAGK